MLLAAAAKLLHLPFNSNKQVAMQAESDTTYCK